MFNPNHFSMINKKTMVEDFGVILSAKDNNEIKLITHSFIKTLGFEGFLFSRWVPDEKNPGDFIYSTITTFSTDWMDKYYQERFYLNDPALAHCHNFWHPLPWTSDLFKSPEVAPIHEEARSHGISAGCAIPIMPDACGFSFVRDQSPDAGLPDVLRVLPAMKLLTGFLMEGIRLAEKKGSSHEIASRLTPREIECVKMMAAGFRDLEISDKLNITCRTVVAHIANARQKLSASNRSQLIAKSVALKII